MQTWSRHLQIAFRCTITSLHLFLQQCQPVKSLHSDDENLSLAEAPSSVPHLQCRMIYPFLSRLPNFQSLHFTPKNFSFYSLLTRTVPCNLVLACAWHSGLYAWLLYAFSAFTLLVGRQEGHPARKIIWGDGGGGHWLVWMEWRPAGWSVLLPLLISPCTIKSRSSLLAPAHPGGPGKRAVKRLWCGGGGMYVHVCVLK